MKTEVLKKHHYWIVAGVSLLLVLLAFFMLSGGVSEAIETEQKAITSANDALKNAQAPGKVAILELEKQKKALEEKKGELWKENWENQKAYYVWPKTPDGRFDKFNDLKFGTPFAFTDEMFPILQKEEVYRKMYQDMADSVAPTKFNNGWTSVLNERFIGKWGDKKPDPKQLWLAMEDVWVLRAMFDPIRSINRSAAEFEMVQPAPNKLKRTFRSRIWQIELEVVDGQQSSKIIKAKLKNLTNQMQLLGSGSALTLKVWLDPNPDLPPIEFKVEGEFIPGDMEINVSQLPSHILPLGTTVTELAKVEQVLDDRTVPIRQIENVSLSHPSAKVLEDLKATDMADFKTKLQTPDFWKDDANAGQPTQPGGGTPPAPAPVAAPAAGTPSGSDQPAPRRGTRPGTGGVRPGMGNSPFAPAPQLPSGGDGSLTDSVDNNRKRYLEVTGQLRRMPVAIKMVLDFRYMQDVMVAYANSPLRFQIVQYQWARYRGTLMPSAETAGSTSGAGANDSASITGSLGGDLNRGGPPRGADTAARPGYIPGLSGGTLTNVSEAQANSALIELTIYGIVTLYEKYEVKKDPATPAAGPTAMPSKPAVPDAVPPKAIPPAAPPPATPEKPEQSPAPKAALPADKPAPPVTPPPTPPPAPKL